MLSDLRMVSLAQIFIDDFPVARELKNFSVHTWSNPLPSDWLFYGHYQDHWPTNLYACMCISSYP